MNKLKTVVLLFLVAFLFQGCGSAGNSSKSLVIPSVNEQEALDRCKAYLTRYAEGNPMGSEMADIDRVYDALKNQPEKLQLVKGGFEELAKLSGKPAAFKKKAQEILDQME